MLYFVDGTNVMVSEYGPLRLTFTLVDTGEPL
jgi:hypothetical protein